MSRRLILRTSIASSPSPPNSGAIPTTHGAIRAEPLSCRASGPRRPGFTTTARSPRATLPSGTGYRGPSMTPVIIPSAWGRSPTGGRPDTMFPAGTCSSTLPMPTLPSKPPPSFPTCPHPRTRSPTGTIRCASSTRITATSPSISLRTQKPSPIPGSSR